MSPTPPKYFFFARPLGSISYPPTPDYFFFVRASGFNTGGHDPQIILFFVALACTPGYMVGGAINAPCFFCFAAARVWPRAYMVEIHQRFI